MINEHSTKLLYDIRTTHRTDQSFEDKMLYNGSNIFYYHLNNMFYYHLNIGSNRKNFFETGRKKKSLSGKANNPNSLRSRVFLDQVLQ